MATAWKTAVTTPTKSFAFESAADTALGAMINASCGTLSTFLTGCGVSAQGWTYRTVPYEQPQRDSETNFPLCHIWTHKVDMAWTESRVLTNTFSTRLIVWSAHKDPAVAQEECRQVSGAIISALQQAHFGTCADTTWPKDYANNGIESISTDSQTCDLSDTKAALAKQTIYLTWTHSESID